MADSLHPAYRMTSSNCRPGSRRVKASAASWVSSRASIHQLLSRVGMVDSRNMGSNRDMVRVILSSKAMEGTHRNSKAMGGTHRSKDIHRKGTEEVGTAVVISRRHRRSLGLEPVEVQHWVWGEACWAECYLERPWMGEMVVAEEVTMVIMEVGMMEEGGTFESVDCRAGGGLLQRGSYCRIGR